MAWKFDNPWGGGNAQNPWDINGAEAQKVLEIEQKSDNPLSVSDIPRPTISKYITDNYPQIHYFLYSFMSDLAYNPAIISSYLQLVGKRVSMQQVYDIFLSIQKKSINLIIDAEYSDEFDYNKRTGADIWQAGNIPGIAVGNAQFDNFYGSLYEGYDGKSKEHPRGKSKYGTIFISKSLLSKYDIIFEKDCFAPKDINRAAEQLRFAKLVLHELAHYICYIANWYPVSDGGQEDSKWDNGAAWELKTFGYTHSYAGTSGINYAKGFQGGIDFLKGKNVFSPFFRGILYYGDCNNQDEYVFV